MKTAFVIRLPWLFALCFCIFAVTAAHAQERFTVQSSARGMENAKQAAQIRQIQVKDGQQDSRLSAVETDIGKIADHAWKSIALCGVGAGTSGVGYKITWNPAGSGTWGCIQETDPTVKSFAKTDLPSCSAGQVLRADGTKFICTTSSGTSGFEVDPYVQSFARNTDYTINACAADEILTMTASRLRCVKSKDLSISEVDPTVQPFAKAALPECSAGQVLTTGIGSGGIAVLRCVTDTDGGYAELDPSVGIITNTKWCMASSGKIQCNQEPPVLTETDPTVKAFAKANLPTCTAGKVLTGNGTTLSCADAAAIPGGSNGQIQFNKSGVLSGDSGFVYDGGGGHLRYNGTGYLNINTTGSYAINATTSSTYGISVSAQSYGVSSSITGRLSGSSAVHAKVTTNEAVSYGVRAETVASLGAAVYGTANNGADAARFVNGNANGKAVHAEAGGANAYAVYAVGRMHATKALSVADRVTATSYYQSSDRNLKQDIAPVSNPFALLNAIEGKHYVWKDSKQPAFGVIAQDVEKVMPEAVKISDSGIKTVEYSQLIAPLIEAVKELKRDVEALQQENQSLRRALSVKSATP